MLCDGLYEIQSAREESYNDRLNPRISADGFDRAIQVVRIGFILAAAMTLDNVAGTTNVPTTNVPTTNVPTTNAPTTNAPTTNVPTEAPITKQPTPPTQAPITPPPTPRAPVTCQWASFATASSAYAIGQDAMQATGPPKVAPACGDLSGAWSPSTSSSDPEWLEVSFDQVMVPSSILIYETYRAPFVTHIELVDAFGSSEWVYPSVMLPADSTSCGSALRVNITGGRAEYTAFKTVRIHTVQSGFEQIDAVQLCGSVLIETCQWASSASASSSYGTVSNSAQSPQKATGAPDVNSCGDNGNAWAPSLSLSAAEWLEVSFDQVMVPSRILIYETYQAPFVTSVELMSPWYGTSVFASVAAFAGPDSTACGSVLEVNVTEAASLSAVNTAKIHTGASGHEQIDAVQLCGTIVAVPPPPPPGTQAPTFPRCEIEMDLVLVIDNSGSVGAQRPSAVEFIREVISTFELGADSGQIGLVEFETFVITHNNLTSSREQLNTVVDNLPVTGDGTYLSGGIEAGASVLQGVNARLGVPKVMLVLSDGVQTVGGNDNTAIAAAQVAKDAGIRILVWGFGGVRAGTMVAIASPEVTETTVLLTTAQKLVDLLSSRDVDLCTIVIGTPSPTADPGSEPTIAPTVTGAPTGAGCQLAVEYDAARAGEACTTLHASATTVTSQNECASFAAARGFSMSVYTSSSLVYGCSYNAAETRYVSTEKEIVFNNDTAGLATSSSYELICKFQKSCTPCANNIQLGDPGGTCSDLGSGFDTIDTMSGCMSALIRYNDQAAPCYHANCIAQAENLARRRVWIRRRRSRPNSFCVLMLRRRSIPGPMMGITGSSYRPFCRSCIGPTANPTTGSPQTAAPTTRAPTLPPTTGAPTNAPSNSPSNAPSNAPSIAVTNTPSNAPTPSVPACASCDYGIQFLSETRTVHFNPNQ